MCVCRGLWNVPFVSSCYLVNASLLADASTRPLYSEADLDADMAFAQANRRRDIFMHLSNRLDFGHLVTLDHFNTSLTNPDLYQLLDNKLDWEARYLHPEYANSLEPGYKPLQPCPDVYWFPIVTPRFAREFVEVMETFGKWSDGSNYVSRSPFFVNPFVPPLFWSADWITVRILDYRMAMRTCQHATST